MHNDTLTDLCLDGIKDDLLVSGLSCCSFLRHKLSQDGNVKRCKDRLMIAGDNTVSASWKRAICKRPNTIPINKSRPAK